MSEEEIKQNMFDAIRTVLSENISVNTIDDSGTVDYIIGSKYFPGYSWLDGAYDYKSEIIDDIIKEIETEFKNNIQNN